jgi:putative hemolysin
MTHKKCPVLFSLLPNTSNALQKFLIQPIDWALGLTSIETLHRQALCADSSSPYSSRILDRLKIRRKYPQGDLMRIPSQGPLVVVANHPFGALEGLVLLELIQNRRPDVKALCNHLLARIPELAENLIAVDPYVLPSSRSFNQAPIKMAIQWVQSGGVLIVFPAGEVSSYQKGSKHCVDPEWSPVLSKLIRHLGAPVLPVHFRRSNSMTFHLLGRLNPALRTLRLPRELLNKRGHRILFTIGATIPTSQLYVFDSPAEISEYLRFRTYLLEPQQHHPLHVLPPFLRPKTPHLASAIPEAIIEDEINRLNRESLLASSGRFEVRLAEAHQIPNVLRELGRLREITFRDCGEGTGKPFDLDAFDHYYLHLILWDKEARRIVGAYRMGLSDRILEHKGIPGLYTSTLFKFDESFFEAMGPALEMGRSFIRPEYKKNYQPLLVLWKSIAKFSELHPRYRKLFGVVSMSNDYRRLSKALVVRHLKSQYSQIELSLWAEPRHPFRVDPLKLLKVFPQEAWDHDTEEVSRWVSALEPDGKGIPVLIRHYLKLGAKFAGFNVDPKFNHALDALLVVDLNETNPKRLEKYAGTKASKQTVESAMDEPRQTSATLPVSFQREWGSLGSNGSPPI